METLDTTKTFQRVASVMAVEVEDSVIIFEPESMEYMRLRGVACRIWNLLESPASIDQLTAVLCQEHEVENEVCMASVTRFLAELREVKLVTTQA